MLELRPALSPSRRAYRAGRSGIHGRGLFAARRVEADERVVEYLGQRRERVALGERGQSRRKVYIFEVAEGIYLDGDVPENAARYMNHSCAPNCEAVEEAGRIWMVARRRIAAGEELTFDYGFRLGNFLVHTCQCGTPECAGFIVNAPERWRARRLLGQRGRSLIRRPQVTREAGA